MAPDDRTGIDTTVPHSARIWNYWLGGKDNYLVDREAGDAWLAIHPEMTVTVRAARGMLQRGVSYMAGEAGVRQFLDIGTGLPTADNTHEVAQRIAPDARVVYVDNDPLVLAHARVLMTSNPQGATHYLHTDMRDTAKLIELAGEHLDFSEPVGVVFMEVLGHLPTAQEAKTVVSTVMDALAPGSHLLIGDGIKVEDAEDAVYKANDEYNDTGAMPYHVRPLADLRSLFDGLEFVEPGLVSFTEWRPDNPGGLPSIGMARAEPLKYDFGGLARKPGPSS